MFSMGAVTPMPFDEEVAQRIVKIERRLARLETIEIEPTSSSMSTGASGIFDIGPIRIIWGDSSVTPSWSDATDHAHSGPHEIEMPDTYTDSSRYIVTAQIRDGQVSARAAWLTYIDPNGGSTFQVYFGAADNSEADANAIIVNYIATGCKP